MPFYFILNIILFEIYFSLFNFILNFKKSTQYSIPKGWNIKLQKLCLVWLRCRLRKCERVS